jgi:hypothetical protein
MISAKKTTHLFGKFNKSLYLCIRYKGFVINPDKL